MRETLNPRLCFISVQILGKHSKSLFYPFLNEGVAEFWVKLMETHHKFTNLLHNQKMVLHKLQVVGFLPHKMTPGPSLKMLGFFSLSTRDEGPGVCCFSRGMLVRLSMNKSPKMGSENCK